MQPSFPLFGRSSIHGKGQLPENLNINYHRQRGFPVQRIAETDLLISDSLYMLILPQGKQLVPIMKIENLP